MTPPVNAIQPPLTVQLVDLYVELVSPHLTVDELAVLRRTAVKVRSRLIAEERKEEEAAPRRFRLIPSRAYRHHRSWFVYGEQEARTAAESYAVEHEMAVVVAEHPEGGYAVRRYTIPAPPKPKKKAKASA